MVLHTDIFINSPITPCVQIVYKEIESSVYNLLLTSGTAKIRFKQILADPKGSNVWSFSSDNKQLLLFNGVFLQSE